MIIKQFLFHFRFLFFSNFFSFFFFFWRKQSPGLSVVGARGLMCPLLQSPMVEEVDLVHPWDIAVMREPRRN